MSFSERINRLKTKPTPGSCRELEESPTPFKDWSNFEELTYKYRLQTSEDLRDLEYIKTPQKGKQDSMKKVLNSKRKSILLEDTFDSTKPSEAKNEENILLNSQKLVLETGKTTDTVFSYTSLKQFDESIERVTKEKYDVILMLTLYLFFEFQKKGSKYFQIVFNNFLEKLSELKDSLLCFQLILKCNEISLFNFKLLTNLVTEMSKMRYLNLILEGNSLRKESFKYLSKRLKGLKYMAEVRVTIREIELLLDRTDEVEILGDFISLFGRLDSRYSSVRFEGVLLEHNVVEQKYELIVNLLQENKVLCVSEFCEKLTKSLEKFVKSSSSSSSKKPSFLEVLKSRKDHLPSCGQPVERVRFKRILLRIEHRDLGSKNFQKLLSAVGKIAKCIDDLLLFFPGNSISDNGISALCELLESMSVCSLALNLNQNSLSPAAIEKLLRTFSRMITTKKLTLSFSKNKHINASHNRIFLPILKLSMNKLVYLFILFADEEKDFVFFSEDLFQTIVCFRYLTFFQSNMDVSSSGGRHLRAQSRLDDLENCARRRLSFIHMILALKRAPKQFKVPKRIINEVLELYL